MEMRPPHPAIAPVGESERLAHIDILRGVALLGVLLINVDLFSGAYWAMEAGRPFPLGWGGGVVLFLRQALVEGKAVSLLSFLFGVGMAMQWERARGAGRSYAPFALRRMAVLALIGLAHSFLLWNGDILVDYAVLGLAVLPLLGLSPKKLAWLIPVLFLLAALASLPFLPMIERAAEHPGWILDMERQHFGAGTWLDALRFRAWETIHVMGPLRIQGRLPMCVPFFVLGIIFWKLGWLAQPARHARALRRLFILGMALGLAANLLPREWVLAWTGIIPFRPLRVLLKMIYFFGRPFLVLGFLGGLLLLLRRQRWLQKAFMLVPLGRMALTQYLAQSLACSLVFYGFGFGLFGTVPLSLCVAGALAFFAVQVWSSRLWLRHYFMGPAEWLWRCLAYGVAPRFRRAEASRRPPAG